MASLAHPVENAIVFEERGEGLPVLAIHGFGPDHRMIAGCLEPIFTGRPGYRRIYPDLPGMGASSPAPDPGGSDQVLQELLTLIDQTVGSERFLVVGHSYGGYLARAVLHARAGQVAGLALLCPIGTVVDSAERSLPEHRVLVEDPAVAAQAGDDSDFRQIAVVQTRETWERTRREILPGQADASLRALARLRTRYALTQNPDEGPVSEVPAVIVTGRQDSVTGYDDVWPLLQRLPRATFAVLDRAGHHLHLEQPAVLDALLGEWLDRVREAEALRAS